MTESTQQALQDHFAHCIQVLGGVTAASRRLGIDERAIRRFINAERPISPSLLDDTAKTLRLVSAEALAGASRIDELLTS